MTNWQDISTAPKDGDVVLDQHAGTKHLFQERLTQMCAVTLGVKVTSTGYHSGVKVISAAP